MNPTSETDTHSPWYEAFAQDGDVTETVWLPGTQFGAQVEEAEAAVGGGAEEQWATEALFDCYNA